MNIVVVSPYNIANYGAMLQGWALRTVLERMGHDVRHLQAKWMWHGVRQFWRIFLSRSIAKVINKVHINSMMRKCYAELGNPPRTRDYYSFSDLVAHPPKADCYIVGSDQVFALQNLQCIDNMRTVLLDFGKPSVRRIGYAVSFGRKDFPREASACSAQWRSLMARFKMVGVREQSGVQLCEEWMGKDACWTPDPTLLLTKDDYIGAFRITRKNIERFVLSHFLGFCGSTACQKLSEIALTAVVASRNGDVRVCSTKDFATVREWLEQVSAAEYVVSNSFHAICFALLFHRPFIALGFSGEDAWRNERVLDLLAHLNLSDRFFTVENMSGISTVVSCQIDWTSVDCRLEEFRQVGNQFLREAFLV